MRIIDASCTENGSDGGDGSPEGTDKLSTSVKVSSLAFTRVNI
jgi:hypothetical protein